MESSSKKTGTVSEKQAAKFFNFLKFSREYRLSYNTAGQTWSFSNRKPRKSTAMELVEACMKETGGHDVERYYESSPECAASAKLLLAAVEQIKPTLWVEENYSKFCCGEDIESTYFSEAGYYKGVSCDSIVGALLENEYVRRFFWEHYCSQEAAVRFFNYLDKSEEYCLAYDKDKKIWELNGEIEGRTALDVVTQAIEAQCNKRDYGADISAPANHRYQTDFTVPLKNLLWGIEMHYPSLTKKTQKKGGQLKVRSVCNTNNGKFSSYGYNETYEGMLRAIVCNDQIMRAAGFNIWGDEREVS